MVFFGTFGDAVTLSFDLLTTQSNQLISDPRCITDKSLVKIYLGPLDFAETTSQMDARTL